MALDIAKNTKNTVIIVAPMIANGISAICIGDKSYEDKKIDIKKTPFFVYMCLYFI